MRDTSRHDSTPGGCGVLALKICPTCRAERWHQGGVCEMTIIHKDVVELRAKKAAAFLPETRMDALRTQLEDARWLAEEGSYSASRLKLDGAMLTLCRMEAEGQVADSFDKIQATSS